MPINGKPINSETPIQSLVDYAISEIAKLNSGEKFMVRDLFLGYEWNRLSNYVRAQVGYGFFHQYAKEEKQVTPNGKSAQNQQKYKKN